MGELLRPRCAIAGLTVAAKRGYRTDYKCGGCGLAFSISWTDLRAIKAGQSACLVEVAARNWLRRAAGPSLRRVTRTTQQA